MRHARSHIVAAPRPSSTGICEAPVFQAPRRHSLPGYRIAKMPDFRQVVTRAPVAAMDHVQNYGIQRTAVIDEAVIKALWEQRIESLKIWISRILISA